MIVSTFECFSFWFFFGEESGLRGSTHQCINTLMYWVEKDIYVANT